MSKKRHSQIFSLQLANHDDSFGPRAKPPKAIRILRWIALTPAVALFILPSFKIGRQVQREPQFAIPDIVEQHSVFTIPTDPQLFTISLSGRPLPQVASKNLLLAVASSSPVLDLELVYRGPDRPFNPKSLLPKLEHPTFSVFSKTIRTQTQAQTLDSAEIPAQEKEILTRTDGQANAACWIKPAFEIQRMTGKIRPNVWTPRYASLTATAPGEVVQAGGGNEAQAKAAVIYHGGGLYSVYRNVKEMKVRKGDRIQAGQLIALAHAGSLKQPNHLSWGIYLSGSEINPENFLQTSSQLCDLK